MKKILLSVFLFGLSYVNINAQSCTPGANFVDSTYGVWPDTTQNLPWATVNVAYSTDINFKVPATVTIDLDPSGQFVGSPIQSFTVTGLSGLPVGYNYGCNISGCTYSGGANGCANVYGTTATTGTYPVTIDVDATVLVTIIPGLPPTPVTQAVSFGGYKIIVGNAGLLSPGYYSSTLTVVPNPTAGKMNISGLTEAMSSALVSITNIEGKVVASQQMNGTTNCAFDLTNLHSGIYFASIQYAGGVENIKFILD